MTPSICRIALSVFFVCCVGTVQAQEHNAAQRGSNDVAVTTAPNQDPLFINLSSAGAHRSLMAIGFGRAQQERGHGLTIYLNNEAVFVASKNKAKAFVAQQEKIMQVLKNGGHVIVCPSCMKKFGLKESDLLAGVEVGNPDLTGALLFKANTKTLSW